MTQENVYDLIKEYLTQQEVADLFRVSPGTIRNCREAGYLDYLHVPGSSRILYPVETINKFERKYTKKSKVIEFKRPEEVKKMEGQVLSSNRIKKAWRI